MKKIKVLIIEDDPMVADINKRFTESVDGFIVVGIAKDGQEALHLIQAHKPDLLILDIYMPNLDGVEVLTTLRQRDIPIDVILITAANDTFTIDKVMRYGVVDYIIKPFKFERFKGALEAYLEFKQKINQRSTISQPEIDRYLTDRVAVSGTSLPKNVQEQTLIAIFELISSNEKPLSAEEVAEGAGVSRITARRYLEYLVQEGKIQMGLEYLPVGRPIHKFKLRHPH